MALAVGLAARPGLRGEPRAWLALLLPPAVAVVAFVLWRYAPGDSSIAGYVLTTSASQWGGRNGLVTELAQRLVYSLVYLGVFTLPVVAIYALMLPRGLAALDRGGKLALAVGGLVAAIGYLSAWVSGPMQIPYLGSVDHSVHSLFALPLPGGRSLPADLSMAMVALGLWGTGGLALGLALGAIPRSPRLCWHHPYLPFFVTGALLGLTTISAYLVVDRYYFPLLPFALAAVVAALPRARPALPLAVLILGLTAALSVVFMFDKGQRAALQWEIGHELVRNGIPEGAIDAGSGWVAWWYYWRQYPIGEGVPGQLGRYRPQIQRPYLLTYSPMPGYAVEQTHSFWTPLGWKTRQLYVLRREPAPHPGP
jgi:hypothetical protein